MQIQSSIFVGLQSQEFLSDFDGSGAKIYLLFESFLLIYLLRSYDTIENDESDANVLIVFNNKILADIHP